MIELCKETAKQAGQAGLPPKKQNERPSKTHVKTLPKPSIWIHLGQNRGGGHFTAKSGLVSLC